MGEVFHRYAELAHTISQMYQLGRIAYREDLNRLVAPEARMGERVMMTHNPKEKETDKEIRQKSNRTYWRIAASLPRHVSIR